MAAEAFLAKVPWIPPIVRPSQGSTGTGTATDGGLLEAGGPPRSLRRGRRRGSSYDSKESMGAKQRLGSAEGVEQAEAASAVGGHVVGEEGQPAAEGAGAAASPPSPGARPSSSRKKLHPQQHEDALATAPASAVAAVVGSPLSTPKREKRESSAATSPAGSSTRGSTRSSTHSQVL